MFNVRGAQNEYSQKWSGSRALSAYARNTLELQLGATEPTGEQEVDFTVIQLGIFRTAE